MNAIVADYTKTGRLLDLQDVLQNVEDLPSIPETLIEILRVLDDPDSGASDLAEVVRLDAPLMTKVLRLANSPYYSSRGDLTDIHRCVAVLGYRTMRQVAICVSVATSLVPAMEDAEGGLDYRELWRHSVICGAVAKHLARVVGHPDPEEIFTAGLLHDVGKFVMELYTPDTYGDLIRSRAQENRALSVVEKEAFGFDHAEIGAAFAEFWRFPELLVSCFKRHHERVVGQATNPVDLSVALVALADYLANTIEPPRNDLGFDPSRVHPLELHQTAGLEVSQVESLLPDLRDAIAQASVFLDLG